MGEKQIEIWEKINEKMGKINGKWVWGKKGREKVVEDGKG